MGGFGGAIIDGLGDALGEVAGKAFDGFKGLFEKDAGAYGYARSGEALLKKSKAGTILSEYLTNEVEPAMRKSKQAYVKNITSQNLNPQQASALLRDVGKRAWHDTRKIYMGQNDELLIKAIAAGTRQRGPVYGNSMADVMSAYFHDSSSYWRTKKITFSPGNRYSLSDIGIRATPKYVGPEAFEENLRQSLGMMYTQGIAIPHLSQILNPFLREGISSTAKALSEWTHALVQTGKPDKVFKDVIDSGVLADEFLHEAISDAKTPGASIADKLFNHPGFNWVRRQQITMAALAGKHTAEDAAAELRSGLDPKLNTFRLQRLGVDVNSLAQRGYQLSSDDIQSAMHQAGVQNMFIRSELATPWKWQESFAMRSISTYKHFNFRQTQFLFQTFRDAYKYGGSKELAKTLAFFGTVFPVVGWFVKSLEDAAIGKGPENPFSPEKKGSVEYADAIAHAAGWGIFYSMFNSGMKNYSKGFFEGPLLNTLDDLIIGAPGHAIQGAKDYYEGEEDKGDKQMKAAARLVVSKFGIPGRAIAAHMKEEK